MKKSLSLVLFLVLFSIPLYAQTQGVHKEDRPHVSGDDGVAILFRRCDAVISSSTATDGDYTVPCVDSNGNIRISGAMTVDTTGLATSTLQGGGLPAALGADGGLKVSPFWYGTLASGATAAITDTTSTVVIAALASNYIYVTNCVVSNADVDTATEVVLQDGSGGTVLYTIPADFGYGGATLTFPVPLKVPTAGNALYAAPLTTGSTTKISCSGFKSTVSY